jgi:hypothetical protein
METVSAHIHASVCVIDYEMRRDIKKHDKRWLYPRNKKCNVFCLWNNKIMENISQSNWYLHK